MSPIWLESGALILGKVFLAREIKCQKGVTIFFFILVSFCLDMMLASKEFLKLLIYG